MPIAGPQTATTSSRRIVSTAAHTPEREFRAPAHRPRGTLFLVGRKWRLFSNSLARAFRDELTHLLVRQKMAFNSPVWFNVGVQPSRNARLLITSVQDTWNDMNLAKTGGHAVQMGIGQRAQIFSSLPAAAQTLSGGGNRLRP